ncbi:hypothetical protein BGZ95_007321, partial [Linnemannia exigua]
APVYLSAIKRSLRDVTRISSRVKRTAQRAIGQYIERLSVNNIDENDDNNSNTANTTNTANATNITNTINITNAINTINTINSTTNTFTKTISDIDRRLLDILCPAFTNKDLVDSSKDGTTQEPDGPAGLEEHDDSLDKNNEALSWNYEEYAGSSFLRSAALQLSVELKTHYKNGAVDLRNKNFVLLNRACGSGRSLVPISSYGSKFINLSELDLIKVFWQDLSLRRLLQSYAFPDIPSLLHPDKVSQADVILWLSTTTPGLLITRLITDIGGYSQDQRKKLRNYSRSAFLMPLEEMRGHLQSIRDDNFEPTFYAGKGYVLRGSIRTDGFRLQVLAFKLNELHSVKYRRLPAEKLPCRLKSTIGGTDYFLTEIRNVVSTSKDVARLWNCDPKSIKILGIDLGQAFVVGASAILPPHKQPSVEPKQDVDVTMKSLLSDIEKADENDEAEEPSPKFFNLA